MKKEKEWDFKQENQERNKKTKILKNFWFLSVIYFVSPMFLLIGLKEKYKKQDWLLDAFVQVFWKLILKLHTVRFHKEWSFPLRIFVNDLSTFT